MRGRVFARFQALSLPGITPAYAGKRLQEQLKTLEAWDHPRVCGEEFFCTCCKLQYKRITPAYAGKSPKGVNFTMPFWDHPRVCGEENSDNEGSLPETGSPPRMRGRVAAAWRTCSVAGITPAYAGKRSSTESETVQAQDHPRVCGEESQLRCAAASCEGSPPRMRGRVPLLIMQRSGVRITPAYAGKSSEPTQRSGMSGDHPRVCGEEYQPKR